MRQAASVSSVMATNADGQSDLDSMRILVLLAQHIESLNILEWSVRFILTPPLTSQSPMCLCFKLQLLMIIHVEKHLYSFSIRLSTWELKNQAFSVLTSFVPMALLLMMSPPTFLPNSLQHILFMYLTLISAFHSLCQEWYLLFLQGCHWWQKVKSVYMSHSQIVRHGIQRTADTFSLEASKHVEGHLTKAITVYPAQYTEITSVLSDVNPTLVDDYFLESLQASVHISTQSSLQHPEVLPHTLAQRWGLVLKHQRGLWRSLHSWEFEVLFTHCIGGATEATATLIQLFEDQDLCRCASQKSTQGNTCGAMFVNDLDFSHFVPMVM